MFRAFTRPPWPPSARPTWSTWALRLLVRHDHVCRRPRPALLHAAIFPFACQKSGSRRIRALYERMVTHRHRAPETQGFLGYAEGI